MLGGVIGWFGLLAISLVTGGQTERDLYDILGVGRDATSKEIRKAFKTLAMKYHPDKNPDPGAAEIFQEVNYAKEILMDDEKRQLYDRCGHACLNENSNGGGGNPFGGNPFDVFENFFGGGGGGFNNAEPEIPKGQDVVSPLEVSLEELYTGTVIPLTRIGLEQVTTSGTRECNCRVEMKTVQRGPGSFQMMQERVCDECQNIKLEEDEFDMEIPIEPGMENGQMLIYYGGGEVAIDGEPGDLKIVLHQVPDRRFHRIGNDLYTNMTISLTDALVGFSTTLDHLGGKSIKVERLKVTWPGFKQRIRNAGMPIRDEPGKFGALVVTFDVDFPTNLDVANHGHLIRQIFGERGDPVQYNDFY